LNQINEQFVNATRQFAEASAEANRLALPNAQDIFGLQLAAVEKNATATFPFFGELDAVPDAVGLKDGRPKGEQVALANSQRASHLTKELSGPTLHENKP